MIKNLRFGGRQNTQHWGKKQVQGRGGYRQRAHLGQTGASSLLEPSGKKTESGVGKNGTRLKKIKEGRKIGRRRQRGELRID